MPFAGSLGPELGLQVARMIRESVCYALDHREPALNYALQFARDMDPPLADKFIGMYVNRWTLDYGEEGRRAVRELLDRGKAHRSWSRHLSKWNFSPTPPKFAVAEARSASCNRGE